MAVEAIVVSDGAQVLQTGLVVKGLTHDVHKVVLKIVVATVMVGYADHEFRSTSCVSRIVIVVHLRPALDLEVVERWSSVEDALMGALLIVAGRTVVDAVAKKLPHLLQSSIIGTIACLDIRIEPLLSESGNAVSRRQRADHPRQFTHQLKHHGIVFRSLHREAIALQMLTGTGQRRVGSSCQTEIADELVHTTMQSDIGTEILQHAEQPWMLAVAVGTSPHGGCAEHWPTF